MNVMGSNRKFAISTLDRPSLVDMNVVEGVFDPSVDHHSWGRWRMAVNDKLVDRTRLRELHKQLGGPSHSLTEAPYSQYLRVSKETRKNAYSMMSSQEEPDQSPTRMRTLNTGQFLYYGIPRLVRNPEYRSRDTMGGSRGTEVRTNEDLPTWSFSMEDNRPAANNNYSMMTIGPPRPNYHYKDNQMVMY